MAKINAQVIDLDAISLKHGSHASPDEGMCVMEAVAFFNGDPFSDAPSCASSVIRAFCVSWNDGMRTDEDRDRLLKPLIPLIVGTRTTAEDEETRAWMATDWLVRVHAPAWLRLAGLTDQAALLASLAPLDPQTCPTIIPTLEAVRSDAAAAGAAAGAAAWTAARAAARAAAGAAARAAARAAAGAAAGAAAWTAAWDAARAAAGAAAWAAAWDALARTVTDLQASAQDLLRRMCEVGHGADAVES